MYVLNSRMVLAYLDDLKTWCANLDKRKLVNYNQASTFNKGEYLIELKRVIVVERLKFQTLLGTQQGLVISYCQETPGDFTIE